MSEPELIYIHAASPEGISKVQETSSEVHVFDNGLRIMNDALIEEQRIRYAVQNLHEPEEEGLFVQTIREFDTENPIFVSVGAGIGYYVILVH